MKRKIVITKEETSDRRGPASAKMRAWSWKIMEGHKVLFGGYCRTKKDAENDAGIVWRGNDALRDGGPTTPESK